MHIRRLWKVAFLLSIATPLFAKKVVIEWKPLEGAVQYELELVSNEQVVVSKIFSEKERVWKGELSPGVYNYRIRAIDWVKRPGEWSSYNTLAVVPTAPEPTFPEDGTKETIYASRFNQVLKWNPIKGARAYAVDIKGEDGLVQHAVASSTQVTLEKLKPGKYTWQVQGMVEAAGRGPASGTHRRFTGESSPVSTFTVEYKPLEAPVLNAPVGRLASPSNGKMELNWDKVTGAKAYEVKFVAPFADANTLQPQMVRSNQILVNVPTSGNFSWSVRALASLEENTPETVGPTSTAKFKLDPLALYLPGRDSIGFYARSFDYNYRIVSLGKSLDQGANASAFYLGLNYEHWFFPAFGMMARIENLYSRLQQVSYEAPECELAAKFRLNLSGRSHGWGIFSKIGFMARQFNEADVFTCPLCAPPQPNVKLAASGVSAGVGIQKEFSNFFTMALSLDYFYPLVGIGNPADVQLIQNGFYSNVELDVRLGFWLSPEVEIALVLSPYNERALVYTRNGVSVDHIEERGNGSGGVSITFHLGKR